MDFITHSLRRQPQLKQAIEVFLAISKRVRARLVRRDSHTRELIKILTFPTSNAETNKRATNIQSDPNEARTFCH
jgi:hypothetical protein